MTGEEQFLMYFWIGMIIVIFWDCFGNMKRYAPPQQATLIPSNPQPSPAAGYHHVINILPSRRQNGLEHDVLKSIPTFTYATSASSDPQIECSVCLSVFKDRDTYRELPTCKHRFHAECIDLWFYSHSNCPLCRANIEGPVQSSVPVLVEPTGARETRLFIS